MTRDEYQVIPMKDYQERSKEANRFPAHSGASSKRKQIPSIPPLSLRPRAGRAGFTLLEMMIVVSIIAILTAVATVSFRSNIDKIKVNGSSRTIALTMSHARIRAITENNYYVVGFREPGDVGFEGGNIEGYVIEILDDDDNNTTYTEGERVITEELRPGIIYHFPIGNDFKCSGASIPGIDDGINFPDNEVCFYPRGNASTDGEIYLIPDNSLGKSIDSNRRCVYLARITGKATVYKYSQKQADDGDCPWEKE